MAEEEKIDPSVKRSPIKLEISNGMVIPGQRLCRTDDRIVNSKGTYVLDGNIFSSLVGYLKTTNLSEGKVQLSVSNNKNVDMVPVVGGLVTGRITQVTSRHCRLSIFAVGNSLYESPFRGHLRKEDVRPTEKDKVEMHKCFKPGDIVICRVISVGDAQSYILSTAENELGVLVAMSEAGAEMVPISWREMQCPKSLTREFRKVAKPNDDYISRIQTQTAELNLSEFRT